MTTDAFLAEALAVKAAFTTAPTSARFELINDTIQELMDAGLWAKLDGYFVLRAHDSQASLINWITPTAAP